ncbi:hypothetical protein LJ707_17055 [Mucilaginibacter sp. UR6-1]|uniref:DUF6973 domain-containing protein n=1 Tax=Mucilaginibacter sp. UR6-1 TaxID=1435643 RepID=UPI001E4BC941|nr:hypothetical protein [Mucilaginibacter sp. UR6-1]MCC8410654.1 hypothetical protein [Mucilaginibacter sp. UR6-1]
MKNLSQKAVLFLLLVLFSCSKKSNVDDPQTLPEGQVTEAELKSLNPLPTIEEAIAAYDKVTTDDPALKNDEEALGRKLFNYFKYGKATGVANRELAPDGVAELAKKLTYEEWKVVILSPNKSYKAYKTVVPAGTAAQSNYPCDADAGFEDSKADAIRHAYWNVLMAKNIDSEFAEKMATAHESEAGDEYAKKMDLHNNAVGRRLVKDNPTATTDQLLQVLIQGKFTYLNKGDAIPADNSSLVYFKAKRVYDGTYNGSMTNPDSNGGPWTLALSLNQCGDVIRGQFEITRPNSSMQKRRFTGKLVGNSITLDVATPYEFENPDGLTPCNNMVIKLNGDATTLSGNWTSSNCSKGGELKSSR